MPASTALLLIAHGSRHEEANADTRYLAHELTRRGPYMVAVAAFLELAAPTIDEGGAECVERGARRVILLPHFLSPGVHVRCDLTQARDRLASRYPSIEFRLAEPIGRHPQLISILLDRAAQTHLS